jgi:hypothetical protein
MNEKKKLVMIAMALNDKNINIYPMFYLFFFVV